MAPRVVTLVPWRGGDELREQSYDVVRPYLERMGWPIFEGDSDGVWSRGPAINAASERAGDWDVAVIADADTIPPARMDAAVAAAHISGGGIRPHDHLYRLSPSGSIRVARDGIEALEPRHILDEYPGGGLLVIARRAWDRVGGYSDAFVGWGHEDSFLGIQLVVHASWDRLPGEAWHLWHPDSTTRTREYMNNRRLLHQARMQYEHVLNAASRERGYDLVSIL